MSDPIDIVERLREAQSAVDSFRGDLGSAAFEDACRTARHRAFLAAPALLAQLDEQAAEITRLRALSAQPAAVPGWQLVPVEPTLRQMAAMGPAIRACYALDGTTGDVTDVYRAMLSSAPQAPQQDEAGHNG